MRWTRKLVSAATVTLAVPAAIATALAFGTAGAQAATSTLCNSQTAAVAGGTYTVQNNEWGSGAPECITTDGNADFSVANSSIDNATNGAPGGYPSLYKGCHWGACTSGSGLPIPVSSMTAGAVTTSWSTTQPGTGAYDVAYDIWFNTTPTTSGQPNGAELMIWLNHNGSVQPFGSQVGTATVGGRGYNVWFGNQGWNTISYTMTTGATSVSNLDIDQIVADAVSRGYIQPSWYLIDVEAGFELWQGGAGLATNSFAVNVNSSGSGSGGGWWRHRWRWHPAAVHRLHGRVLGGQLVVGRLPGPGHRDQHRHQFAERLAAGLDVPRRPEDQQSLERQLHPVRPPGQRDPGRLQRDDRPRLLGHGRFHRHRHHRLRTPVVRQL